VISLEQVRQLDIRVKKAVTAVKTLSTENSVLKQQIADLEARLDELDKEASNRIADEQQLEVSLQGVLDVLDEVDGETSKIEPEPPGANYVIETVPEPETVPDPENNQLIEDESDKGDLPEPDVVFAANTADTPDAAVVEMPAVEEESSEESDRDDPETVEADNDVPETESEESETGEEIVDPRSEDSEPEIVSLDNDRDEEDETDDNDKFQSEFDIF
jgi:hypothetical protein